MRAGAPHGPRLSRAVAIGGGHGLHRTLQALARIADDVTAVVTVADDGGSSGRLRRDLGVLPPGDMRMALAALCPDPDLVELLQYRFPRGELEGHSLGNLILVALSDLAGGDALAGTAALARLLGVRGRVLPCTPVPLTLHAEAAHGRVRGQRHVTRTPRVERVWVEPAELTATPQALDDIADADLVVLGPGSLYTSLIPNLLVPDIAKAVNAAGAPVVFVANLREQPGETEGMDLGDHLAALDEHIPGLRIDVVLAHEGPDPSGPGRRLRADVDAANGQGTVLRGADLLDGEDGHDPDLLGAALLRLVDEAVAHRGHASPDGSPS